MGFRIFDIVQRICRAGLALALALTVLVPATAVPAAAASGDRTLYLYYTHTKETGKFTFRKNGRYDQKVLAELNRFLRDWRRNEPAKMDPALFDLIWEVYQDVRGSGPIHIVSAYRAPATNEMLRAKSSGVAENSRHTQGMAMDFFVPGVPLAKLREAAFKRQVGGVGYYPTSGSPFVHLDTGNVRAWPRMTRAQLQKLFPDGKTLHLPTDGTPLSQKGYQLAKAEWQRCRSIPCNGAGPGPSVQVAQNDGAPQKNLFELIFGNDSDGDAEDTAPVAVASASAPARSVTTRPATAPVPMARPDVLAAAAPADILVASAPVPQARPARPDMNAVPEAGSSMAVAAIDASVAPQPRVLMTGNGNSSVAASQEAVTAYAPASPPAPEARRALDTLIERRLAEGGTPQTNAPAAPADPSFEIAGGAIRTASIGDRTELDRVGRMITDGWNAVARTNGTGNSEIVQPPVALPPQIDLAMREGELIAPDLEHVTEIFADPRPLSSERYGVLFENDQADIDPATELGRGTLRLGTAPGLTSDRFNSRAPLLLASR